MERWVELSKAIKYASSKGHVHLPDEAVDAGDLVVQLIQQLKREHPSNYEYIYKPKIEEASSS